MRLFSKRDLENINDLLSDKSQTDDTFYGWYLDSNGMNKYFLSLYNPTNYSEELIFEIDFTKDNTEIIVEGLRFHPRNKVRKILKRSVYYSQAIDMANYIKERFVKNRA